MNSCTSARPGTTFTVGATGRPQAASAAYAWDWVAASKPSRAPMPWQTIVSFREAVTVGSFWRSDPAAVLRALA